MSELGHRIKELRIQRGLSQAELGKRIGVTASAVSQLESKEVGGLKGSTLVRLAEALGVEPAGLMSDSAPQLSIAPDEAELLAVYRSLPYGHRVLALRVLRALA